MNQSKFFKIFFNFCCLSVFLFSCQPSSTSSKNSDASVQDSAPAKTLNVYTNRESIEDKDLIQRFVNLTGANVKFNVLDGQSLLEQTKSGAITPDLMIFDDMAPLMEAKSAELLQPFSTGDMEENIPFKYKDVEGFWVALGKSGIAVIYDKTKIKYGNIRTYADLTKAEFKGRILLSGIEEKTNRYLLSGMIEGEGEKATSRFAKALLVNQVKAPSGTDLDVIKGIAAGEGDIGLVDVASLLRFRYSGNPDDFKAAENLFIIYPTSKDGITYLSFRAAAIPKNSTDRPTALRFVEYLTNDLAQQTMSEGSFSFPVNPMVVPSDFLIDQGGYRDLENDLNTFGQLDKQARAIAKTVGWE